MKGLFFFFDNLIITTKMRYLNSVLRLAKLGALFCVFFMWENELCICGVEMVV